MLTGNIRKLCRAKNITTQELESLCGFGKSTIYRWDSVRPSIDKVIAVANFFNVSLDALACTELETDAETLDFAKQFNAMDERSRGLTKLYMAMLQEK